MLICQSSILSTVQTNTAYIYFGLAGDFDPYEFAARIPLLPDKCVAKHARKPELKIPRQSLLHYAQLGTFSELIDVYELAEKAVNILEPHLDSFASAIRDYDATATLQLVLNFPVSESVSTPMLGFSKRVVAFVASAGASIDIDTYRV